MEIEVNEYVRINKNSRFLGIGKIIKIVGNTFYVKMYTTLPISFSEDAISEYKHSKDKIDLIEVGDYVNGELVEQIEKNYEGSNESVIITNCSYFYDEDIKSILTKEQFVQNCYEVEG